MIQVMFVGSVASGKTSTARALKKILGDGEFLVKYVDVNVNHGFAYIITRFIASLLRYKYVGNYYLTIRFNNEAFFCKYLRLMQILDILYIPIKYFTGLKFFIFFNRLRKKRIVILLDEYYLNSIVDYLYFSKGLCRYLYKMNGDRMSTCKLFYSLAFRLLLLSLKKDRTLIIHLGRIFDESVKGWRLRERTYLVDESHILFRSLATKVILNNLKRYVGDNVQFKSYLVQDFTKTSECIIKDVLDFMR